MATSFQDLLKEQEANSDNSGIALTSLDDDDPVAYSDSTEENWTRSSKYTWYEEYVDDMDYSVIDSRKNVTVNPNQTSLTQEVNSQFISFLMPRYSDGIDIANSATLNFHIVNAEKNDYMVPAVNVSYSSSQIRFHFLMDEYATAVAGTLQFEIIATGTTSAGTYRWKTRPNSEINILESLSGNGTIEPGDGWDSYIELITNKVTEAQTAAKEAQVAAQEVSLVAKDVDEKISNATSSITSDVTNNLEATLKSELSKYYTKEEVDTLLSDIDFSELEEKINNIDGLANFKVSYGSENRVLSFYNGENLIDSVTLNSNPTSEWVSAYDTVVDEKIAQSSTTLQNEINSINENLSSLHSDIDDLPETLKSDYYTKTDTNELLNEKAEKTSVSGFEVKLSSIETNVNTNKTNISLMGNKISELEETLENVDLSSSTIKYDVDYNEENVFSFYEIENEGTKDEIRTTKKQFKISGGTGGGATSSSLKIEYVTKSPLVVTSNDSAVIRFNFSGTDSSGDEITEGTATWKVGSTVVTTSTVISGENSFDITNYISLGSQKVLLSITDDAGSLVTKTWTVQKIDVRLESSFDDTLTYPISSISFDYTPYGAISKVVHFILDGEELPSVTTSSSGLPLAYTLPEQTHGTHFLDVYMTAEVNGSTIESNHIYKDIIWYDTGSDVPVIGCTQQNFTVMQYDTTNISYTVYDPKTETPKVTLAVDGVTVSTLSLTSNVQSWLYKSTSVGSHELTITCRDTVKTLSVTITKLDIDIEPVTAGLEFDFNPTGKSNSDEDRLWSDGSIVMSVSDNFDWVNGGYQVDDNGDQYFGVKAGSKAVINYPLFGDDAKKNGKEFKVIFKTENVRSSDATFLKCIDDSSSPTGLEMNVHEAYVRASAGSLYLPYAEERIIEFEFNINKNTDTITDVRGYEDGVATRPMVYNDSHSFTQDDPQYITIGCDDCDVLIYRMKAYSTSLTDRGILNNFIADARSAEEMIERYNRNQIYDENSLLTPESVANACKDLKVIKIECPHFTNDKKDFVKNTSVECIHTGGDPVYDNWKFTNCYHSGQGTTSNEYGASSRNLDILACFDGSYKNSKITYDENYKTVLTLGDGTKYEDGTGKVTLTRTSVPSNYFNIKVNVASSENVNNALLQQRFNTYLPYSTPASKRDSRVKNDMEFVNCVIFLKESDPDISTHREFEDTEWHFYSIGNIGDSKKTDFSRVTDPTDPNEFIVEIMDNTLPNSTFSGSEDALVALDADVFDEKGTYGFRYEMSGITSEQQAKNIETWRKFYRFVATSEKEYFTEHLSDWFIKESALYFYLFTERYTMIDNRAKNTFWHWSKIYISDSEVEKFGDDAKYYTIDNDAASINDGYRFEFSNYDNDTALGINNSGELTMTYGKEDTDYRTDGDASSGYIYNGAESKFFCNIRDWMYDDLAAMFVDRESQNCWSATSLINQFDSSQAQFPEELWRLDIERKYLRTYRNGITRFLSQMMNGKKKYQRAQFEVGQEKYMATKYFGTTVTSEQIMFRCNTPTGAVVKPDYTLHLTPYSDMYLSVMFGASYRTKIRAKAGIEYDIACPFTTMDDTSVLIYNASQIQAIGDLSGCYIHDNDFSKGTKLRRLTIGNSTEGYQNTFLENLGIGNNTLLEYLDIRNTPKLANAVDLSGCPSLKEFYADGSGLTGVTFASGGKIETAHLPASITSLTMKNLYYLTDLAIAGYDNIIKLIIENCPVIDSIALINNSTALKRLRATGVDWDTDDDFLKKMLKLLGVDASGYDTAQSVLTGVAHIPTTDTFSKEQYEETWQDLEIDVPASAILQAFTVTFRNPSIDPIPEHQRLDIQHVIEGQNAVDPITRADNPISTPTMIVYLEDGVTIATDYTFREWDLTLTNIRSDRVITALYDESVHEYTAQFVNKDGTVLQKKTGAYGTSVEYTGTTPTYTKQEAAYIYNLFRGWKTYPFITGDITIEADYDTYRYDEDELKGMSLEEMSPVQIYAVLKNVDKDTGDLPVVIHSKDKISFTMGENFDYDNVESTELFPNGQRTFTGTRGDYYDTGIALLDEDEDWVLAVDYKWDTSTNNAVLMQCFQNISTDGFRMRYNSGCNINWGSSSQTTSGVGVRDMIVLRHVKGETDLHVYLGNQPNAEIKYSVMSATRATTSNGATLIFGAARSDDNILGSYATGTIYSARLFKYDIGDTACRQMALWPRENIEAEMCGIRKYYLSDNSGSRCTLSFLMSHLLSNKMSVFSGSNVGGWGSTTACKILQDRFYKAIPVIWRQLLKECKIGYNTGYKGSGTNESNATVEYVNSYVTLPSILELSSSYARNPYDLEAGEPDDNGSYTIDYMLTTSDRARAYEDGTNGKYITRSAMPQYSYAWWAIMGDGDDYSSAGSEDYWSSQGDTGICLEFSI